MLLRFHFFLYIKIKEFSLLDPDKGQVRKRGVEGATVSEERKTYRVPSEANANARIHSSIHASVKAKEDIDIGAVGFASAKQVFLFSF